MEEFSAIREEMFRTELEGGRDPGTSCAEKQLASRLQLGQPRERERGPAESLFHALRPDHNAPLKASGQIYQKIMLRPSPLFELFKGQGMSH